VFAEYDGVLSMKLCGSLACEIFEGWLVRRFQLEGMEDKMDTLDVSDQGVLMTVAMLDALKRFVR
jgi:hypothetical protein